MLFIPLTDSTALEGLEFPVFCFRLALDVAGGAPFAHLLSVGLAIVLALATNRLAHMLVTCHWSQVTVLEFGVEGARPPEERGIQGDAPFCSGTNLVND
jgi:hypothetical protein